MTEEDLSSEDFENEKEEVEHIADAYGVEKEEADEIKDLAEELGIDEDDAYDIWEAGI